jgi:hypothetical protein
LLTELAALPEPEFPESVGIRMDAAIERAWQELDADAEREAAPPPNRGSRRPSWRKLAIPLGALSLIALAVVGVGVALNNSSVTSATSSGSSSSNAHGVGPLTVGTEESSALTAWVQSLFATGAKSPMGTGVHCANPTPQRSGYTILTTSHRDYAGRPATLVVYQNTQEPASPTVYAVVYAGSCHSAQKSTSTGLPLWSTSWSKVSSVTFLSADICGLLRFSSVRSVGTTATTC